ncbi:twin-arginine translocation signal domain-containing protein [Achromobacter aegrifaciens]
MARRDFIKQSAAAAAAARGG